jgi:hypothetical protein
MELNHTDDVGMQTQKMISVANEIIALNEALKLAGDWLNECIVESLRAETDEAKKNAKIKCQEAKGKFAAIKADIRAKKEIINVLKMLIRAEGNAL